MDKLAKEVRDLLVGPDILIVRRKAHTWLVPISDHGKNVCHHEALKTCRFEEENQQ